MTLARAHLDGLPATFKALGRIDPELRKEALKRVRKAAEPIRDAARGAIPSTAPMSGWEKRRGSTSRWAWRGGRARSRITIKAGTGSVKRNEIRLVRIVQRDKLGSVFDMAGRGSSGRTPAGRQMIRNLNRYGQASRSMWPAYERNRDRVELALIEAIDDMSATVNRSMS